jgi:hypothetical protein
MIMPKKNKPETRRNDQEIRQSMYDLHKQFMESRWRYKETPKHQRVLETIKFNLAWVFEGMYWRMKILLLKLFWFTFAWVVQLGILYLLLTWLI